MTNAAIDWLPFPPLGRMWPWKYAAQKPNCNTRSVSCLTWRRTERIFHTPLPFDLLFTGRIVLGEASILIQQDVDRTHTFARCDRRDQVDMFGRKQTFCNPQYLMFQRSRSKSQWVKTSLYCCPSRWAVSYLPSRLSGAQRRCEEPKSERFGASAMRAIGSPIGAPG